MVMLPPQSSRGVLGLRATVSACPTYQLSRSQEPPGILRTKRSRPADGAAAIQTGALASKGSPGRLESTSPGTRSCLERELWMLPALCDLWNLPSPWGAQRCLGERDRCMVSFRQRAAAQSPLRAVRDASYFRRTRPKLNVHVSARRPHSDLDSPKTQFLGITLGMLRTSPFWGGKKPVTLRPADVCQSVCNVC